MGQPASPGGPLGGSPDPTKAPPPNNGGATAASANPGSMVAGMSMVHGAIQQLETALPILPMGSEEHQAVLDAVSKLVKKFPAANVNQSLKIQGLLQGARKAQSEAPLQMLQSIGQGSPTSAPAMMPPSMMAPPPQPQGDQS